MTCSSPSVIDGSICYFAVVAAVVFVGCDVDDVDDDDEVIHKRLVSYHQVTVC